MARRPLLLALMLVAPSCVLAKCADDFYTAKGRVVLDNGKAAAGAVVGVSWVESGRPGGPAIATADADGRYTVYIHFRKFSGMGAQGDECNGRLSELAIRAYTATRQSLSFRTPLRVDEDGTLLLGTIPVVSARDGQ